MNVNLNVREFEILNTELNKAIIYLRNCRTDVRNADLFQFLDKAINVGKSYSKMLEGFKELEDNNVDIERYQVVITKNCALAKSFIDEISRVKSIAQA